MSGPTYETDHLGLTRIDDGWPAEPPVEDYANLPPLPTAEELDAMERGHADALGPLEVPA